MAKFLVHQYEVWVRVVEVEAENGEAAKPAATQRFSDGVEDSFEYSHVSHTEVWEYGEHGTNLVE